MTFSLLLLFPDAYLGGRAPQQRACEYSGNNAQRSLYVRILRIHAYGLIEEKGGEGRPKIKEGRLLHPLLYPSGLPSHIWRRNKKREIGKKLFPLCGGSQKSGKIV